MRRALVDFDTSGRDTSLTQAERNEYALVSVNASATLGRLHDRYKRAVLEDMKTRSEALQPLIEELKKPPYYFSGDIYCREGTLKQHCERVTIESASSARFICEAHFATDEKFIRDMYAEMTDNLTMYVCMIYSEEAVPERVWKWLRKNDKMNEIRCPKVNSTILP